MDATVTLVALRRGLIDERQRQGQRGASAKQTRAGGPVGTEAALGRQQRAASRSYYTVPRRTPSDFTLAEPPS